MKTVLVIDMPTRCYDCPLYTPIDDFADEYGFCDDRNILKQKEAQEKIRFDEKPIWCPLRPLPQKTYAEFPGPYKYGFADGWNRCLEEIQK